MQDVDVTRRGVLRGLGAAGSIGVTGCLGGGSAGGSGVASGAGDGTSSAGGDETPVSILAAGSLQHAIETGLTPAVDVPIEVEAHGSATVARMVADGTRDPDIVTVADTALFEAPLSPSWYSVFTSNAVVLAYNSDTDGGRRVAEAGERWYDPLVAGDVRLGRTDPDQDPLGYRTLFTLELASRYYDDAENLHATIPRRRQIYPETALVSQFETGAIDAAFTYRNMAVERGYDYHSLPAPIDLSDPAYTDEWYATVSYTLPSGQEIGGEAISYGSTVRNMNETVLSVFDHHTTGRYLDESGFLLREEFPSYEGTVPAAVSRAVPPATDRRSARGGTPTARTEPTVDGTGRYRW
jgi:molybdate/tungstate transport system substrate-binding protein